LNFIPGASQGAPPCTHAARPLLAARAALAARLVKGGAALLRSPSGAVLAELAPEAIETVADGDAESTKRRQGPNA
jgi:hypothetical protein